MLLSQGLEAKVAVHRMVHPLAAAVDAPAHGGKIKGDEQENDEKQFHVPKIGLFAS